ncbi:hypothetical protein RRG08_022663 [Elysia crispata]|uniref:Uncharacterized protein n=1 Tax=Elysia crispata TaxID=231223 RepID=A0AAE1D8D0_9GAST|nr:hypothetical protein RRG08_022663 [Elysia crispata]
MFQGKYNSEIVVSGVTQNFKELNSECNTCSKAASKTHERRAPPAKGQQSTEPTKTRAARLVAVCLLSQADSDWVHDWNSQNVREWRPGEKREINTNCTDTPHDGPPVYNHSPAHTAGLAVRDTTPTSTAGLAVRDTTPTSTG